LKKERVDPTKRGSIGGKKPDLRMEKAPSINEGLLIETWASKRGRTCICKKEDFSAERKKDIHNGKRGGGGRNARMKREEECPFLIQVPKGIPGLDKKQTRKRRGPPAEKNFLFPDSEGAPYKLVWGGGGLGKKRKI